MTKQFKDYTDFKTGSYWIYQDSANTANLDSIAIVFHYQFILGAQDGSDGPGPNEEFTDTLISSLNGKIKANANSLENVYHVQYGNWPDYETTYFTPINGSQYDDVGNMTLTDSSENLNVAGHQYQFVKEFKVYSQGGSRLVSPITNIWWAKNIGVIQKTDSTTTWQLIRYHVMQ